MIEIPLNSIISYGLKIFKDGLVSGTGGNLSLRSDCGGMFIKPSAIPYDSITPECIPLVNLHGDVLRGHGKPSSEWRMHMEVYKKRGDINAIIHTHSVYAATVGCLGWAIPAVHYLIAEVGAPEVPCAPYRSFGSAYLADVTAQYLGTRSRAVLMANHGLLAAGRDMEEAYNVARTVEYLAEIYWRAKCAGEPVTLSPDEVEDAIKQFDAYRGRT